MYPVPYGYVIVFIALDVIPSIEKKNKHVASQKYSEFLSQFDRV